MLRHSVSLVPHVLLCALIFPMHILAAPLAQNVTYLQMHSFLHSYDKLPKVILLREPDDNSEAPSWFTSAAVRFKQGKTKTASFAVVIGADSKVQTRFGITEMSLGGKLVVCLVDGNSGGTFHLFPGTLREGGGNLVREVSKFVTSLIEGREAGSPLPAFPPPDVPRKKASASLSELTHENINSQCYGGKASICIMALLSSEVEGCPAAFSDLAWRHRNDAMHFGWVRASRQTDFLAAFSLKAAQLPLLVAVRAGKRSRFALLKGPFDADRMIGFVERILGGDMTFSRLQQLPDLEPPALLDSDDDVDQEAASEDEPVKSEL